MSKRVTGGPWFPVVNYELESTRLEPWRQNGPEVSLTRIPDWGSRTTSSDDVTVPGLFHIVRT